MSQDECHKSMHILFFLSVWPILVHNANSSELPFPSMHEASVQTLWITATSTLLHRLCVLISSQVFKVSSSNAVKIFKCIWLLWNKKKKMLRILKCKHRHLTWLDCFGSPVINWEPLHPVLASYKLIGFHFVPVSEDNWVSGLAPDQQQRS